MEVPVNVLNNYFPSFSVGNRTGVTDFFTTGKRGDEQGSLDKSAALNPTNPPMRLPIITVDSLFRRPCQIIAGKHKLFFK